MCTVFENRSTVESQSFFPPYHHFWFLTSPFQVFCLQRMGATVSEGAPIFSEDPLKLTR